MYNYCPVNNVFRPMLFICKGSTPEEIAKQLRQLHKDHPNDTHLEISSLPPDAAGILARHLPPWVKSIGFGRRLLPETRALFVRSLSPDKRNLIEQPRFLDESFYAKRKAERKEPEAKKFRKDEIEFSSSRIEPTILISGLISNFIAGAEDISLIKPFVFASKRHRKEVYFRLLKVSGDAYSAVQLHLLGTLIRNGSLLVEISGIETALTNYRHREDIQPENRMLVTCCLAIMAIFKNDQAELQKKLHELFIYSVPYSQLFMALCCYIYLYKGEIAQCHELAKKITDKPKYLQFNASFSPRQPTRDLQKEVSEMEASLMVCENNNFPFLKCPKMDFFKQLEFYPELSERYADAFWKCIKLLGDTVLDRIDFYLPKTCKKDPDYVAICYFINAIYTQDKVDLAMNEHLVRSISSELRQKVFFILFEGLQEILDGSDFVLRPDGIIFNKNSARVFGIAGQIFMTQDPTLQRVKHEADLWSYFEILKALKAKTDLIVFIRNQITNILAGPVENSEVKIFKLMYIIKEFNVADYLLENLWWFYNKYKEDKKQGFVLLQLIACNYLRSRCSHSISKAVIIKEVFDAILKKYYEYERQILGAIEADPQVFEEKEMDMVLALKELCGTCHINIDEKIKKNIFRLLTSMSFLSECELLLIVLRCCFDSEKELEVFLKSEISADAEQETPRIFLSAGDPFAIKNKWVSISIIVLAPYLESMGNAVIEKYIKQLHAVVSYLLDNKAQLEEHKDYSIYLDSFVLAIVNLLFFISSEMRKAYLGSLSEELNALIFSIAESDDRDSLSLSTLNKINESDVLLSQYPLYLNRLCYKGGHNFDFLYRMKIDIEKGILAKLYEKRIYFDPAFIVKGWRETANEIILYKVAAMMALCIEVAEKKELQETTKLLEEFQGPIGKENPEIEDPKIILAEVKSPFTILPLHLRLFKVACLSHNPAMLLYVLSQYKNLNENEKAELKTQMDQLVLQFRTEGYMLCEKIEEVLIQFNHGPQAAPVMLIG